MTRTDSTAGAGRTAIVTGAARRLGAAIAEHLHGRGLNVVIHCRSSREEAEALAETLNTRRPDSAVVVAAELADEDAPGMVLEAVRKHFGRLDVLVHNASAFYPTPVKESTRDAWDELMDSNLRGPYFLSAAAAPMLAETGGSIVNLVDIHGLVPLKNHAIYSQAKAGLIMQTKALAKELAPQVRVNAVAPGTILWPEDGGGSEAPESILKRIPLGRQGTPEDIAGAVAFLALDAPYITGQVLAVDGGRLLNM